MAPRFLWVHTILQFILSPSCTEQVQESVHHRSVECTPSSEMLEAPFRELGNELLMETSKLARLCGDVYELDSDTRSITIATQDQTVAHLPMSHRLHSPINTVGDSKMWKRMSSEGEVPDES